MPPRSDILALDSQLEPRCQVTAAVRVDGPCQEEAETHATKRWHVA
ncbi:MAG: hypothetical protein O3B13_05780 [Planctomycetota bacterium]|nr:hypothetical protein [Planctomycetota bacterium]